MNRDRIDRRSFALAALSLAAGAGSLVTARHAGAQDADPGIGQTAATIHQEVIFHASPARVYQTLTEAERFDKVVHLGQAIKAMTQPIAPAELSRDPGGAFSLFGGFITGRQIELTPNAQIIQAWRSEAWPPHLYSIAKFDLAADPSGTKLVFDQTGFPNDQATHLATGWRENYWEPMARLFG